MRAFCKVVALVAILILSSCGKAKVEKSPLKLEDVPPDILKIAKDKMPEVNFTEAFKEDGNYELRGKDKKGKIREIDITPEGKVVEMD